MGISSKIGPDLLAPPHILPVLMELLAGDKAARPFTAGAIVFASRDVSLL